MLKSDLCDFSDVYIVVKRTITVDNNAYDKKLAFKNNAPFFSCISKINNPLKNLSTNPMEFQWNSIGVMENYWKMTGTNRTSGILLEFQRFIILYPLKFHL